MKILKYTFLLTLFFVSCDLFTDNPDPIPIEACVGDEEITNQDTGIFIINKGLQEFGEGFAIKQNKVWECSVSGKELSSYNQYHLSTFWEELGGVLVFGENIVFVVPQEFEDPCFTIKESGDPNLKPEHVRTSYDLYHDDSKLKGFYLDTTANNKFEIIEEDRAIGMIKAKFQCTFLSEEPFSPAHPEKIRFFNGEFICYGW